MAVVCSKKSENYKCIQDFTREVRMEENNWEM
jgi:hypothetical protein